MLISWRWDEPATLICAPVSATASSSWYLKLSGDFKWILWVGSLDLLFSLLQILIIFSTVLISNSDRSFCFDQQTCSKQFFSHKCYVLPCAGLFCFYVEHNHNNCILLDFPCLDYLTFFVCNYWSQQWLHLKKVLQHQQLLKKI